MGNGFMAGGFPSASGLTCLWAFGTSLIASSFSFPEDLLSGTLSIIIELAMRSNRITGKGCPLPALAASEQVQKINSK